MEKIYLLYIIKKIILSLKRKPLSKKKFFKKLHEKKNQLFHNYFLIVYVIE